MRSIAPHIGLFMALLIGLGSSLGIWYEQHFCFCKNELHQGIYQEPSGCCVSESKEHLAHRCEADKGCDAKNGCGESETVFWQLDVDYVPANLGFELSALALSLTIPTFSYHFTPVVRYLSLPQNKAPPIRSAQQRRVLLQSFLC